MFRLATGEHAEQEAEADGDGNCRQRVAPDGGFSLVGGVHRFIWARLICLLAMRPTVELRFCRSARIASI